MDDHTNWKIEQHNSANFVNVNDNANSTQNATINSGKVKLSVLKVFSNAKKNTNNCTMKLQNEKWCKNNDNSDKLEFNENKN